MRLAATVAALFVMSVQGTALAAAEPVLQDVVVAPGSISSATTMALAPDGRIFVAEQARPAARDQERRAARDAVPHRRR